MGLSVWRRLTYLSYRIKRRYGCQHPGNVVVADILDGDNDRLGVQWCRRCGAYRIERGPWHTRGGLVYQPTKQMDWRIPARWWDS